MCRSLVVSLAGWGLVQRVGWFTSSQYWNGYDEQDLRLQRVDSSLKYVSVDDLSL